MELCRYGSLHTLLDSPENGYGVAEETFLLILKHVGTVFIIILLRIEHWDFSHKILMLL